MSRTSDIDYYAPYSSADEFEEASLRSEGWYSAADAIADLRRRLAEALAGWDETCETAKERRDEMYLESIRAEAAERERDEAQERLAAYMRLANTTNIDAAMRAVSITIAVHLEGRPELDIESKIDFCKEHIFRTFLELAHPYKNQADALEAQLAEAQAELAALEQMRQSDLDLAERHMNEKHEAQAEVERLTRECRTLRNAAVNADERAEAAERERDEAREAWNLARQLSITYAPKALSATANRYKAERDELQRLVDGMREGTAAVLGDALRERDCYKAERDEARAELERIGVHNRTVHEATETLIRKMTDERDRYKALAEGERERAAKLADEWWMSTPGFCEHLAYAIRDLPVPSLPEEPQPAEDRS